MLFRSRGGDGAEFFGGGFGFAVVEIREIEMAIARADLHGFEGVVEVGVAEFVEADGGGAVGIDADDGGAARFEIGNEFFDAFFVSLGGWAMVAGENDGESFGVGEIFEGIVAAVHSWEIEIGRG